MCVDSSPRAYAAARTWRLNTMLQVGAMQYFFKGGIQNWIDNGYLGVEP